MELSQNVRLVCATVLFLGQWLGAAGSGLDSYTEGQQTWIQANVAIFVVIIIASVVLLGFLFTCCCCCCACCRKGRQTVIMQGGAPGPQTTVVMSQQPQQMGNARHAGYDQ